MTETLKIVRQKLPCLVKIVCSSPMRGDCKKAVLRRIENGYFLSESYTQNKVFHERIEEQNIEKWLKTQVFECFKQSEIIFTDETVTILTNKKGTVTKKRRQTQRLMDAVHNRKKNYLINEGEDVPALKDLGVFTAENKIAAKMHDKFRQINRFIETVDDVMSEDSGEITVLDFGCGKSYLTFLLYHYLTVKKGLKTRVIGYDIKEDVVENCNKIAKRYGYSSLEFVHADVKKDKLYDRQIDMVVSLHACDTATDFALDYAIKRSAKYIFSVPCCQHEINAQIRRGGDYDIFLTHGLLKERFSALLTDAIRAEVLENAGYRVDCMEFVGFDASPKNLMLRAVKTGAAAEDNTKQKALLNKYGVKQTLVQLREGTALTAKQEEKNG